MTIGQLLEMLASKASCLDGSRIFIPSISKSWNKSEEKQQISKWKECLLQNGFNSGCKEILINGK